MKRDYEKLGVTISIVGSILFFLIAIVMALLAKSQAILLDGLYTFITLIMSFVSLKVIDMVKLPETKTKPFGYMSFEPFLNLVKSLIVLTVLVVFLVTNLQVLCLGGRVISLRMAVIYIILSLLIYAVTILFLKKCSRKATSSILELEIRNWYIDALLTVGIAVSLIFAMIVIHLGYNQILPYIDPVIVVVLAAVSLLVPLKVILVELKRLLLISPENSVEIEVKKQISSVTEKYGIINMQVWGLKSGRSYYLSLYCDLKDEHITLSQLDRIRGEISKELSKIYSKFWADIIFTRINPEKPYPILKEPK